MNFAFFTEPSVKTLVLGYLDEVMDTVVTDLATVTDQSVCRYVDFLENSFSNSITSCLFLWYSKVHNPKSVIIIFFMYVVIRILTDFIVTD